jgi:hypothetical protein
MYCFTVLHCYIPIIIKMSGGFFSQTFSFIQKYSSRSFLDLNKRENIRQYTREGYSIIMCSKQECVRRCAIFIITHRPAL